jgi:hypothetical protein
MSVSMSQRLDRSTPEITMAIEPIGRIVVEPERQKPVCTERLKCPRAAEVERSLRPHAARQIGASILRRYVFELASERRICAIPGKEYWHASRYSHHPVLL